MMSTVLERFQKAKELWTNKKLIIDAIPDGFTKNEAFHATYHATNNTASRCISYHQVPESDDFGNIAVFLNKTDQFYQLEATERGVEITVWVKSDIADKIDEIIDKYIEDSKKIIEKIAVCDDKKKKEVMLALIVEQKVDEVINNAMNLANNRTVYFSVGKTREFAANVPMLMNASGFSLVQLSMNKWMTATDQLRSKAPEDRFPKDKVKPLLADALKWKKYMIDFLNGNW